jgi:hypothetical protein
MQLRATLATPHARQAFEQAVGKDSDRDIISVVELKVHFHPDDSLPERVAELLSMSRASSAAAVPPSSSSGAEGAGPSSSSNPVSSQARSEARAARCELPQLDQRYTGRDEEAEEIRSLFLKGKARSVLLLGSGGLGKSSLAVDIGWRMWQAGVLTGTLNHLHLFFPIWNLHTRGLTRMCNQWLAYIWPLETRTHQSKG